MDAMAAMWQQDPALGSSAVRQVTSSWVLVKDAQFDGIGPAGVDRDVGALLAIASKLHAKRRGSVGV